MHIRPVAVATLGGLVGCLGLAACSSAPPGNEALSDVDSADASIGLSVERVESRVEWMAAPATSGGSGGLGGQLRGIARYHGAIEPDVTPACRSPKLSYFGGPILQSPVIVPVFWNSNVNAVLTAPTTGIAQFYADVTQSSYWQWLHEYDTVGLTGGTNQTILAGTATAGVTLVPSLCPASSTTTCALTDAQLQTELALQIAASVLPAPTLDCTGNVQTIYMVSFPPNISLSLGGAGTSCVAFCAYHSTGTYGPSKTPLIYAALMDEFTGTCKTGCGSNPTGLENSTDTASHELAEAATDADIGLDTGNAYAKPAAWADNNNNCGEIGDICDTNSAGDTITVSGRSWAVQQLWSNVQEKCTSAGTVAAICSGTTTTNCRKCSCGDNGNACKAGTAVCETTSTNALYGACEQCTATNGAACPSPATCQQSATAAQDDICTSCVPKTSCPAGDNCGTVSDGCAGTINCGPACTSPESCGGGGTANVCGCPPKTSCPAGDNCGTVADGCGGMLSCGPACAAPQTCGGGGSANVCGCAPATSCPAGDNCGSIPDGCGGSLSCGAGCVSPQSCGGGGAVNVCGCTPATTCVSGLACGVASDGCGGTVVCGTCGSNQTCANNQCVANGSDAGTTVDAGAGDSGTTADAGPGPDAGSPVEAGLDSGGGSHDAGPRSDSGSIVDSGASSIDTGIAADDSGSGASDGAVASLDGGVAGDAAADAEYDAGFPPINNSGGCGCYTAQTREAGPSPAMLAFGALALLGGVRFRRRSRKGASRD